MNLRIRTEQVIEVQDWDALVEETYGRPYIFQQQDGCKERGTFHFKVPDSPWDFKNDSISKTNNDEGMGVSFAAWLKRDPKTKLENQQYDFQLELFWERNFYPEFQMVANDLHKKGLLEAGDYTINIDW